jgi:hypothetical protein
MDIAMPPRATPGSTSLRQAPDFMLCRLLLLLRAPARRSRESVAATKKRIRSRGQAGAAAQSISPTPRTILPQVSP